MKRLSSCAAVAVGLAGVAVHSGCGREAPAAAPPPPPAVTVATPVRMDAELWVEFTGTTVAMQTAEIRARVEGYLLEQKFQDSDEATAGQVLFVIDPALYQAEVDRTVAFVERRQAELDQAVWDLGQVESLAARGASTEKEIQDRRTDRALAEAALKSARAADEKARLELGYTDVKSPIAGRLSRNLVDVGNLVGAGEKTLLTTVVQMDPMHVYFNVSERFLMQRLAEVPQDERRRLRTPFWVRLAHEEGYPHHGTLDFINNTVDAATGTLLVRGEVPNDQGLLFPGAFVRVRLSAGIRENAVLVSERALGTDLGGKYLLIVDTDDIVEHRPVTIGALLDGMRVIEDGLSGDERYIVNGLQRARPGLPVRPQMQDPAPGGR
ncbi:MAG: efflux RND transporter periplasmic adaptor subunit [Planctomycetes bacterium]|nr:efflux RND transporter periplasmic adaptor subunit [Planctomycetota bacterium]